MSSRRVPARGGGAVGCQLGEEFLAVRCQLKGQYGASGRNRKGGRGRLASGLATTDQRAIARAVGAIARPSETVMLITEAFPIRGTSPAEAKPYFDRESDTVTPTVSEARSFPTMQMPSEVQSKCGARGRTEHHEREATTNRNENPKEGRPRPQWRRVYGLPSTPRQ